MLIATATPHRHTTQELDRHPDLGGEVIQESSTLHYSLSVPELEPKKAAKLIRYMKNSLGIEVHVQREVETGEASYPNP